MQSKRELRAALARVSRTWKADDLAASDRVIRERVRALPAWRQAGTVFLYVSVKTEPDTHALIEAALAEGKAVAAPRCLGAGVMEARRVESLDTLVPGAYGLPEPPADAPRIDPQTIDLAVIPCVAADRQGRRLGHGAGYYDRFLAATPAYRLCLCRGPALLDEIPAEAHDLGMDAVVTEGDCVFMRI